MLGEDRDEGNSDAPAGREATNPSDKIMQLLELFKRLNKIEVCYVQHLINISPDFSNPFTCLSKIQPSRVSQSHISSSKSQSGLAGDKKKVKRNPESDE